MRFDLVCSAASGFAALTKEKKVRSEFHVVAHLLPFRLQDLQFSRRLTMHTKFQSETSTDTSSDAKLNIHELRNKKKNGAISTSMPTRQQLIRHETKPIPAIFHFLVIHTKL